VSLPKNVHRVVARAREYYYYQEGRGTSRQGPRIKLPNDPHSPEFWTAIRQAQGLGVGANDGTVKAVTDLFIEHCENRVAAGDLTDGTLIQYRSAIKIACNAWADLQAKGLRPVHVQTILDGFAVLPGKANNFLGGMRAFSTWARARDHIEASITEGVAPFKVTGGHKPWTPEQIKAAHAKLKGVLRKGVLLYMYTGMRGSDAVRLGWTDIDDGGFSLRTQKRKRDVWCPIVSELENEMASWTKRPGPFLLQEGGRADGKPYTRKLFSIHFAKARNEIPELAGVTLHGLRATAVVRLRRAGLSAGQIGDIVGMSLAMIERYCRFADRKTSGKAALIKLEEHSANKIVKR
jgi:integrase